MNLEDHLKAITPPTDEYSEKFSFGFAAAIRSERGATLHLLRILFAPTPERPEWNPNITCTDQLYLGFPDDGWIIGRWMPRILTTGRKAERWAFGPSHFPMGFVDVTDAFMARYLEVGKCAIDPWHGMYWDTARYSTDGDTRICNWCGRVEHRHETPRTVIDVTWKPAQATA